MKHLLYLCVCVCVCVCEQALMTDETIGNVPILILGNKIDKPEAISEEKLREIFGLYGQTTGKVRHGTLRDDVVLHCNASVLFVYVNIL